MTEDATQRPLREILKKVEAQHINASLTSNHGNMSAVSRELSVPLRTLLNRCKRLGIDPDRFRDARREAETGRK